MKNISQLPATHPASRALTLLNEMRAPVEAIASGTDPDIEILSEISQQSVFIVNELLSASTAEDFKSRVRSAFTGTFTSPFGDNGNDNDVRKTARVFGDLLDRIVNNLVLIGAQAQ